MRAARALRGFASRDSRGRLSLRFSGLLLRHTVQSAESPDQIAAIDRHDFACGETFRERVERNTIVRIVEDWHQYCSVRNIKIGVAGWQLAALEHDWTRHGNFDDLEFSSVSSAGVFQAAKVRMQGRIILAPLILLDHRHDGIRSDEACDVIDVAMSVVAGNAAIEPNDGLRTKIVGEHLLISCAVHG